jgi:hypothetical protein
MVHTAEPEVKFHDDAVKVLTVFISVVVFPLAPHEDVALPPRVSSQKAPVHDAGAEL